MILKVLNLGAGVQSTCMVYMTMTGDLPKPDCAIFADTGWEPPEVYRTLWKLAEIVDYPILIARRPGPGIREEHVRSAAGGKESLKPMPFFTPSLQGNHHGALKRACSTEYKGIPITKLIRKMLGVPKGGRVPAGSGAQQWYGMTLDEAERVRPSGDYYIANWYPLIEMGMRRGDCVRWMEDRGCPIPRKSSCVGCPYHDRRRWKDIKENAPDEWTDAVEFDKAVRTGLRGVDTACYLHDSLTPLGEVDFDAQREIDLGGVVRRECMGLCGV